MTLKEAKLALSGSLEFGNSEQIEAYKFLTAVDNLVELLEQGVVRMEFGEMCYTMENGQRFSEAVESAAVARMEESRR